MTQNTKHTNLFNEKKITPYPVPPAHAPASDMELRELYVSLLPGGTVGYPAQPRLIAQSVSPLSDITFNDSAGNCPSPTNLVKYSLKVVN